jgi:hypothetical protein
MLLAESQNGERDQDADESAEQTPHKGPEKHRESRLLSSSA